MNWKRTLRRLLGQDSEPVVVSFLSGPEPIARRMLDEVRSLLPEREHWAVTELEIPGVRCINPAQLPGPLRHKRIGLAPVLLTRDRDYGRMRWQAFRLAPHKLLAFNERLERHHLRLSTVLASFLFWRGVPLDRIWLRPTWLFPFKHDRTIRSAGHKEFDGRPLGRRQRIGVFSPYFPYPLSHGGAVRIYNLLREAARDFDVFLFSFGDAETHCWAPAMDFCAKIVVFPQPRYREPRWASLLPSEVLEFRSEYVAGTLERYRREFNVALLQIEYTQLASYDGEMLVEHDVTFDLYQQIFAREHTLAAWWDAWRWRNFERKAVKQFKQVVAMSEKDARLLRHPNGVVIPNGVDLARFEPTPERGGARLLFVGSFRHFPNVIAYRFFVEEVWPNLRREIPEASLAVIAGPDAATYWLDPVAHEGVELCGFIEDARPFYSAANVAIVPTQVSAGTNLKVLEAMAMERAVVSTTSGCAGLGLRHGHSVWIADGADAFAAGVVRLLREPELRKNIAQQGRVEVGNFDWRKLGTRQKRLWNGLTSGLTVREAHRSDAGIIDEIQRVSHAASHWDPDSYFDFDVLVAESGKKPVGFLVSRHVAGEIEVLNLAVAPEQRRKGVATNLLRALPSASIFLEVRESNSPARALYRKLGFTVIGYREEYYEDPVETAVVMGLSTSGMLF